MKSFVAQHRRAGRLLAAAVLVALAAVFSGCTPFEPTRTHVADLPGTPTSVVAADFNGDGTTDVMSGFDSSFWGVDLALQDDYGFWTRQSVAATALGGSDLMAVTDVNDDGAPDVVAAGQNSSAFTLLTNLGDGTFSSSFFSISSAQITAIASATDTDGTRYVSVAFEDSGSTNVRTMVAASGTLTALASPSWSENPGPATEVLLANLVGDSRVDLIVGAADGAIRVFEGTGAATAFSGTAQTLPASPDPGPVAEMVVGDSSLQLPGAPIYAMADGIPDLVAAHGNSTSIRLWRGDGDGVPAAPEAISLSSADDTGVLGDPGDEFIGIWIDPDTGGLLAAFVGDNGFGDRLASLVVNRFGYGAASTLGGCPARAAVGFEAMMPAPAIAGSGVMGNACESTNQVSIVASQAGRMTVPGPIAFDDTMVGDSSQEGAQIGAPDFGSWGVDQAQTYGDFSATWSITGDDADQFSIVSAPTGCQQFCTPAQIAFTPTSPGVKSAQLEVGGSYLRRAGAPVRTIALSGTGSGAVLDAPASAAAGDVVTGSSRTVSVGVQNTGNADLHFADISIDETGDWYVGQDSNCPPELSPSQSCNLEAVFAPTTNGASSATFRIKGDQIGGDVTVDLSGRGVTGALTAAPVDHGDIVVGDLSTMFVTITNEDDGPVNVASATLIGDDAADFEITGSDCGDAEIPVDATCSLTVTAEPTVRGSRSATIVVASDATSTPLEIPMTVTGLQGVLEAPESVALTDTRVGFFSEKQVELTNDGDADLELGQLAADAPVTADSTCNDKTLAIGESCTATLRLEPSQPGAVVSKLRVPNNGAGGDMEIDLSGTALPKEEDAKPPAPARAGISVRSARVARGGRSVRIGLTVTALDDKAIENGVVTVSLPRKLRWLPMRSRGKKVRPIRQVRIPVDSIEAGKSRNIGLRIGSAVDLRRKSLMLDATLKSNSLTHSRTIKIDRR